MNKFNILLLILILTSITKANEIGIGAGFLKKNYVETGRSGEFLDSETSDYHDISGYSIYYKYNLGKLDKDNQLTSVKLSLRQLSGDSVYTGFLQSNGVIISPYISTTNNTIYEPKITISKTKYTSTYDIEVFFSLANREWTRDMAPPYGYKEVYSWNYYDLGMKTIFYDGNWEGAIEFAYQKANDPKMVAYLNGVLNFKLGETKGYYYKIPLGYNFNKNFKLELEYEYNRWKIGASNIVNGYYEPDSITKNKILNLNLVYRF